MSTLLSFVCTKCRTWKGVRRIVCPFSEHWPGHSRAPYGHLRTCSDGRLFGHRSSSDQARPFSRQTGVSEYDVLRRDDVSDNLLYVKILFTRIQSSHLLHISL